MIAAEARGAWKELEQRLRPYLARRVASAADVDDLLQDIFVRMHRGLGDLRDDERFGGWVYRIAHSTIVDHARRRARTPPLAPAEAAETSLAAAEEPEDRLQPDLAECVALFVSRLPSPYREAMTLTELEGLTQKESADMLGVTLSGLKSRVQRGREKIRNMFEQCCEISVDRRGHVTSCEPRSLHEVPADCRDAALRWSGRARPC